MLVKQAIVRPIHLKTTLIAGMLLIPALSQATNGYFAHGYGTRSKAMAGLGAALPQDAVVSAINPAGLAYIDDRLDLEIELFSPHRNYTVQGQPTMAPGAFPLNPGTVESGNDFFPVPTLAWSHRLDSEQTVGLAFYGNGGMNTKYPNFQSQTCPPGGTGTFCAGKTGVDLMQAFISPSYARSFLKGRASVGIAPIIAVQTFSANGFAAFGQYSSDPAQVSNTGRDWAYGAGVRVGAMFEVIPSVRVGVSYKSKVFMSRFTRYSGLFAQQGDFDVPESINAGLSWQINDSLTAAFDIEHIRYSKVPSVGNPMLPNLMTAKLGNNQGAGFGWQDMTVFKWGAQWKQNKQLTWRGGFSYGAQPIPDSEVMFNIVAPGVQEWHLTAGLTYALSDKDEISFAGMYSPRKSVSGINPMNPSQTINLEMYQYSFQLGWSRKF